MSLFLISEVEKENAKRPKAGMLIAGWLLTANLCYLSIHYYIYYMVCLVNDGHLMHNAILK